MEEDEDASTLDVPTVVYPMGYVNLMVVGQDVDMKGVINQLREVA